jgi:colanic acid/amylovoran biosynthesis glycosyltransferase
LKIAYLTTTYPSVSHTFIRRELIELERQVGPIQRFAIRHTPYKIVDLADAAEDDKTFRVLSQPPARWASALLKRALPRPLDAARGLKKAFELGRKSERGVLKHLAYFAEAVLLLDEMKEHGIEHVHVHFGTNPTAVALILRAMGGPPYSFTVHGPDEFDAPQGLSLGSKIEGSAFVVAISNYGAAQLRRWVPYEHWDKIRVVHCTVGDEFFQAAQPIDPASRDLVCVGRLAPQKGHALLLEAFADAVQQGVDARLVFAGDGELRPELERIARERGIAERVRITGWIDGQEVRRLLLQSRAMILPTFAEGLPMVIMEAFALGRPVLSTYVAGIPELVIDGQSGWLVPAGSKDDLTRAIQRVIATPVAELEAMGARGRAAVRERHYTPTETAKLRGYIEATTAPAKAAQ